MPQRSWAMLQCCVAVLHKHGASLYAMQWSKIRTRLKALLVPALRDRVDFHVTVHRIHHNDHGGVCTCNKARELWITIDKLTIFRASYCKYTHEIFVMWRDTGSSPWHGPRQDQDEDKEFERRELHDPNNVIEVLRDYLDADPHVALRSNDPLLKAMAIIDRRIGVRALRQLDLTDDEHSLVRTFYRLRCSEIGVGATPPTT
jgi:hypothetical protein